jgi:hypothetical protein
MKLKRPIPNAFTNKNVMIRNGLKVTCFVFGDVTDVVEMKGMPQLAIVMRRLPERVLVAERHRHLKDLRLVLLHRRLDEHGLVPRDDNHFRRFLALALVPEIINIQFTFNQFYILKL